MLMASGHGAAQSTDLPVRLQSIQHFYAITRRCETVAPDRTAIRAREAEFAADVKRYEQVVSAVPLTVQVQDCREFESLVEQALSGK